MSTGISAEVTPVVSTEIFREIPLQISFEFSQKMPAGLSPKIPYVVPPEIFPMILSEKPFEIDSRILLVLPLDIFAVSPLIVLDEIHPAITVVPWIFSNTWQSVDSFFRNSVQKLYIETWCSANLYISVFLQLSPVIL